MFKDRVTTTSQKSIPREEEQGTVVWHRALCSGLVLCGVLTQMMITSLQSESMKLSTITHLAVEETEVQGQITRSRSPCSNRKNLRWSSLHRVGGDRTQLGHESYSKRQVARLEGPEDVSGPQQPQANAGLHWKYEVQHG